MCRNSPLAGSFVYQQRLIKQGLTENSSVQITHSGDTARQSPTLALLRERHPSAYFAILKKRPRHPRSVVCNPNSTLAVKENNAGVPIQSLGEITYRFRRNLLRRSSICDPVSGVFREYQLHHRFAPS